MRDDDDDDEDDLFNFRGPSSAGEGGRARSSDPDTSHLAASPREVSILQWRYMLCCYRHSMPLTTVAIANYWIETLGSSSERDSYSPRSRPLVELGHVVCVGKYPAPNKSGKIKHLRHYQLTDSGRAYVRGQLALGRAET